MIKIHVLVALIIRLFLNNWKSSHRLLTKKLQLANDNDNGVIGEITAGELRSMLEKK